MDQQAGRLPYDAKWEKPLVDPAGAGTVGDGVSEMRRLIDPDARFVLHVKPPR